MSIGQQYCRFGDPVNAVCSALDIHRESNYLPSDIAVAVVSRLFVCLSRCYAGRGVPVPLVCVVFPAWYVHLTGASLSTADCFPPETALFFSAPDSIVCYFNGAGRR
jgi:hypothetical protein